MTLLADINNAAARRGVQAYGLPRAAVAPTRRTATPPRPMVGPIANMNDPLSQMARQSNPAPQQQAEEAPAWGKGLGILLNNPITKTALMPLDFLDKGRRAAVYGFGELARLIPEDLEPMFLPLMAVDEERAAEANEAGFGAALGDASYGFGDIAQQFKGDSEWAKWGNRAVGFAGDVGLDPLTYATFGAGAGTRFAGRAGRVELASMASHAGLARSTIEKAGEYGINRLNLDELAQLGITRKGVKDLAPDVTRTAADIARKDQARQGMRLLGKRVPLTGKPTEQFTRLTSGARRSLAGTRMGGKLRELRSEEAFRDAIDVITTGKTKPGRPQMDRVVAAELLDGHNADRMGTKAFQNAFASEHQKLANGAKGDLQGALREAERTGEGPWVEMLTNAADQAQDAGLRVYRDRGGKGVKGWVPHILTPDALKWLHGSDDVAQQLRSEFGILLKDADKESGMLSKRFFKARENPYVVKGKNVRIRDDSVDGINAAFAEAFPELGFKVLDDNMASVASNYLTHLGRDVGKMAQAKRLRSSKAGLVLSADDARVLKDIADDSATGIANDAALAELNIMRKKLENSGKALRDETAKGMGVVGKIITPQLRQALSTVDMLYKPATAKQGERGLITASLKELMKDETTLAGKRDEAVAYFDRLIAMHDEDMEALVEQVSQLERESLNVIEIAESARADTAALAQGKKAERRRLTWELEANAAELEIDRDTLVAARDRVAGVQGEIDELNPKAQTLRDALASEESLAHYGGEDVSKPGPAAITQQRDKVLDDEYEKAQRVVEDFTAKRDRISNAEGTGRLDQLVRTENEWINSGRPIPLDVRARLERQYNEEISKLNEYEDNIAAYTHARDQIDPVYREKTPIYREGTHPDAIKARFEDERKNIQDIIDRPAPMGVAPPDPAELRQLQGRLADVEQRIALAGTPPSGRTLPELYKDVRVAQAKVDKYQAWRQERTSRYANKNIPAPMSEQEYTAARQTVERSKDEIANIAGGLMPNPAEFKAKLVPIEKEIKTAETKLTKVEAADAKRTRAENELDAAVRRWRGLKEPGPKPTRKLPKKVTKAELDAAEKAVKDAEAKKASLLAENTPADPALTAERAEINAAIEKHNTAREHAGRTPERIAQHRRDTKNAQRRLAALPARERLALSKSDAGIVGYERAAPPGALTETVREPLLTPTQVQARQAAIATPEWVPPKNADDPIRVAIRKPKLEQAGSPVLSNRVNSTIEEFPRVREAAERMVENGQIDESFVVNMNKLRVDIGKTATNYKDYPLPHLTRQLESQHATLRRYSEFTLRYAAAVELGAQPGRDLANYVLRNTIEAERNVVSSELKRLQKGTLTATDREVDRAAELFKSLIKDVDNSMNAETWVKKLSGWIDKEGNLHGGINDLPAGEQMEDLRGRIKILEEMQDDRIKNFEAAKGRMKYAQKNPDVLSDELADLYTIETYNREQAAARHGQGRFRQGERTVTHEEAADARARLGAIRETRGIPAEKVAPEDRATMATYIKEQKQADDYRQGLRQNKPTRTVSRKQYTDARTRVAEIQRKNNLKRQPAMRSELPEQELIERFEAEQKAASAYARGERKTAPKRTVSQTEADAARGRLRRIQEAKRTSVERGHASQTAISDLRTKLHTSEDPLNDFTDFLMSEDPSAQDMDVIQALMALPEIEGKRFGRVQAKEMMQLADIPLTAKRKVIKMSALTPTQRRDLAEMAGELANDTSDRSVLEVLMDHPGVLESDKPVDKANYWMRKAKIGGRTPKPTKVSGLGIKQKEALAAQLGAPMPTKRINTPEQEARLGWFGPRGEAGNFRDPGERARRAAYKVNDAEREIEGAWKTLAAMKEKLYDLESGGMTDELRGVKNILEKTFDPATGTASRRPIEGEDLELLRRTFAPEDAEDLRAWSEEFSQITADDGTLDTLKYESAATQAYEFLKKRRTAREGGTQGQAEELDDFLFDMAQSPEAMHRQMVAGALHTAQLQSSDDMGKLIDMFKLLKLKGESGRGFGASLGYNRSRGTLDEGKLRKVLTDRIDKDRPAFKNIQERRIAELQSREGRLAGILQALGKESREPTVEKMIAQDVRAGRTTAGVPVSPDTPYGALREMHMEHVAGMTPPKVYQGAGVDWQRALDNASSQDSIGFRPGRASGAATFRDSPHAKYQVLEQHKARYAAAKERATTHLGELEGNIADANERLTGLQNGVAVGEQTMFEREMQRGSLVDRLAAARRTPEQDITEYQDKVRSRLDDARQNVLDRIDEGPPVPDSDSPTGLIGKLNSELDQTRVAIARSFEQRDYLQARGASLRADIEKMGEKFPREVHEAREYLDDMHEIATQRLDENSPEMIMTETLLQRGADSVMKMMENDLSLREADALISQAEKGQLIVPRVMKQVVDDHWIPMVEELLPENEIGILARNDLRQAQLNISEKIKDGDFTKALRFYTDFFKTYATMSPGFHVRNAMSATIMNMTDNVRMKYITQAGSLWREYRKNPTAFLASHNVYKGEPTDIGKAFKAALGSGAGGQFHEMGVGPSIRPSSKVFNNWFTRKSKVAGEWVEGPVRLAAALDSVLGLGHDEFSALARVTRLHFDYSQVSKMDQKMKLLVPFWTFASRNLPLQVSQMWLQPRVYAEYNSLVRNIRDPDHPYTPQYWKDQGAFTMGGKIGGDPLYFAPDLQHTRIQEQVEMFNDPARLLSELNPLMRVPLETMVTKRKLYTNQPFSGTDEPADRELAPFIPLLGLLGQLSPDPAGGRVRASEEGAYALRSLIPPLQQISRLFPSKEDEFNAGRQQQTLLRYLGIPAYQLSDEVKASEKRRQEQLAS